MQGDRLEITPYVGGRGEKNCPSVCSISRCDLITASGQVLKFLIRSSASRPALLKTCLVELHAVVSYHRAEAAAVSAIASGSQHRTMNAGWLQIPVRESRPCAFLA